MPEGNSPQMDPNELAAARQRALHGQSQSSGNGDENAEGDEQSPEGFGVDLNQGGDQPAPEKAEGAENFVDSSDDYQQTEDLPQQGGGNPVTDMVKDEAKKRIKDAFGGDRAIKGKITKGVRKVMNTHGRKVLNHFVKDKALQTKMLNNATKRISNWAGDKAGVNVANKLALKNPAAQKVLSKVGGDALKRAASRAATRLLGKVAGKAVSKLLQKGLIAFAPEIGIGLLIILDIGLVGGIIMGISSLFSGLTYTRISHKMNPTENVYPYSQLQVYANTWKAKLDKIHKDSKTDNNHSNVNTNGSPNAISTPRDILLGRESNSNSVNNVKNIDKLEAYLKVIDLDSLYPGGPYAYNKENPGKPLENDTIVDNYVIDDTTPSAMLSMKKDEYTAIGQSFAANADMYLVNCIFDLKKKDSGGPAVAALTASVYNVSESGISSVPTGKPLATSEKYLLSKLNTSGYKSTSFVFPDYPLLEKDKKYFITVTATEYDTNEIYVASDKVAPTHPGHPVRMEDNKWKIVPTTPSTFDLSFKVYGAKSKITNPYNDSYVAFQASMVEKKLKDFKIQAAISTVGMTEAELDEHNSQLDKRAIDIINFLRNNVVYEFWPCWKIANQVVGYHWIDERTFHIAMSRNDKIYLSKGFRAFDNEDGTKAMPAFKRPKADPDPGMCRYVYRGVSSILTISKYYSEQQQNVAATINKWSLPGKGTKAWLVKMSDRAFGAATTLTTPFYEIRMAFYAPKERATGTNEYINPTYDDILGLGTNKTILKYEPDTSVVNDRDKTDVVPLPSPVEQHSNGLAFDIYTVTGHSILGTIYTLSFGGTIYDAITYAFSREYDPEKEKASNVTNGNTNKDSLVYEPNKGDEEIKYDTNPNDWVNTVLPAPLWFVGEYLKMNTVLSMTWKNARASVPNGSVDAQLMDLWYGWTDQIVNDPITDESDLKYFLAAMQDSIPYSILGSQSDMLYLPSWIAPNGTFMNQLSPYYIYRGKIRDVLFDSLFAETNFCIFNIPISLPTPLVSNEYWDASFLSKMMDDRIHVEFKPTDRKELSDQLATGDFTPKVVPPSSGDDPTCGEVTPNP